MKQFISYFQFKHHRLIQGKKWVCLVHLCSSVMFTVSPLFMVLLYNNKGNKNMVEKQLSSGTNIRITVRIIKCWSGREVCTLISMQLFSNLVRPLLNKSLDNIYSSGLQVSHSPNPQSKYNRSPKVLYSDTQF